MTIDVALRSLEDLVAVQDLLQRSLLQYVEALPSEQAEYVMSGVSDNVSAVSNYLGVLLPVRPPPGTSTPATSLATAKSPVMPALAPLPDDAEVAELEEELQAATAAVQELRSTLRGRLEDQLASKLAGQRPQIEDEDEASDRGRENWGGNEAAALFQALPEGGHEQLQGRLDRENANIPALRARLNGAADRLQRVVHAVSARLDRPPPNTIERVVTAPETCVAAVPATPET